MPMSHSRPSGRAHARVSNATQERVPGVPSSAPTGAAGPSTSAHEARDTAERTRLDLRQLNLAYLHVARELSRSARDVALTRLGLDAEACAALDRLSIDDMQVLADSHGLLFTLRIHATDLVETARLARVDRAAFDARLLLSSPRP